MHTVEMKSINKCLLQCKIKNYRQVSIRKVPSQEKMEKKYTDFMKKRTA